jgi:hypothetical protein
VRRTADDLPEEFWEQLVTVDEAATLAHVTPSAVHNWITRGYVDRHGDRRWLTGFHLDGVRLVLPLDVLRAEGEVRLAARGGLRKRAM